MPVALNSHRYTSLIVAILLTATVAGLWWYWRATAKPMAIINGEVISIDVVTTPADQSLGLARYDHLPENSGMLFLYNDRADRTFWMKNMKFPIDIVWLQSGIVVGINSNVVVQPQARDDELMRYHSPMPVDQVLELNAGAVQRLNLMVGNTIEFNL